MSNYEYPRLRRQEIVQVLAQFEIASVAENDISNPKPKVVFDLYTRILHHLDFLLVEDNDQLEFDSLEHLDNPDLHVGSVRVIKLYNKIKEMLNALECPKKYTFNFADLLKPDPHRTEFFLGALLNFCLDRDARMNAIAPIVDEFNDLEQKILDIENTKIAELKLAIAECNEAREREMPFVQEVDAKVKELRQTIANLNNKQMSLRTTLKKLKEKTVEMDDKISGAEFRLVQNVQENGNLRSKIAQSPDKVQENLVAELREVINLVMLSEERNRWGWLYNGGGDFTVKSTYCSVAWQLLIDRILTRQNLLRRQIMLPDGDQFCVARGTTRKKLMKHGLTMIWTAVVWAIWKMRNSVIFDNGLAQIAKVVEEVKLWSWKWWLSRVKPSAFCLLYLWISEPLLCLDS
ncbi:hypothetical protein TSUD_80050 [Trifolium subterraneum]|uniref:Kinetochore protein Nuf2 N-terminal domain-containing protein n=1 Tax=Trifolium subterraneum TaxID=3900 RepID=A0A2Z6MKM3_TRISU|nr:hypothetical protein TSUD_80050 [Trifolium subterraneum]